MRLNRVLQWKKTAYNKACKELKNQKPVNQTGNQSGAIRKTTKPLNMLNLMMLNMVAKIAMLNLCLGPSNKKKLIKQLIKEKLEVFCLQVTDLDHNLDNNLFSFPRYHCGSEINSFEVHYESQSQKHRRV